MESNRRQIIRSDLAWIQNAIKNKWLEEAYGITEEYVRHELPVINLQICPMSVREYSIKLENMMPPVVDWSHSIPNDVKNNIQKVLQQHPEGIYPQMFVDTYENFCNMELPLSSYGFEDVMSMVEGLPFIFRVTFEKSTRNSVLVSATKEHIARRVVPTLPEIQIRVIQEVQKYPSCGIAFEKLNVFKNPYVAYRNEEVCVRGCRPISACQLLNSVKEFVITRTEHEGSATRVVLYPKCASCISYTVSSESPRSCLLCSVPNMEEEIAVSYPIDACSNDCRLERHEIFQNAKLESRYEIVVKSFNQEKRVLYGMLVASMGEYNNLMYDLNEEYSVVENNPTYKIPAVKRILLHHLCAFKYGDENPGWFRGMIVGVHKTLPKALVFFMDLGHTREINMNRVYMLKTKFATVPPLALPLKIADLDEFKGVLFHSINWSSALKSRLNTPNVFELSEKQVYELAFRVLEKASCSVKIRQVDLSLDNPSLSILIDEVNDKCIYHYLLHLK